MEKKMNFIKTSNQDSAKALLQMGYKLFQQSDGIWTFLNDGRMTFSNIENVVLTNKLFV